MDKTPQAQPARPRPRSSTTTTSSGTGSSPRTTPGALSTAATPSRPSSRASPRPPSRPRVRARKRSRLAWIVSACALLGGGALTWAVRAADSTPAAPSPAATGETRAAAKPSLTVVLVQPQRTDLAVVVTANGNIAAWQEAVIGAESNGLRLTDVRVNIGDTVRKGQVLAGFVSEMAQADVAQGRAALAEAEANAADAAANAQRARDLQTSGALSAQQINQYLTAERTAAARVEALRATARVQQLRLSQTQVLASDDGVISTRSATVGAVVGAGQELFRLIRGGRLEWRAEVAAGELAQIQPGIVVNLTPAGGSPVQGRVRMVAPTVDAATRNGIVYVDLPVDAQAPVKAGMFARGEFNIARSEALTLPQSAVLLRDGFSYVFKLVDGSKVQQVKVGVGRRVGDRIELTKGLDAVSRVVASGAGFLADGDTVRVVDAAAALVPPAPAATGAPSTVAVR